MQLKVYPTLVPTLSSKPSGVDLAIVGNVEMYVVLQNKSLAFAFTLGLVSLITERKEQAGCIKRRLG